MGRKCGIVKLRSKIEYQNIRVDFDGCNSEGTFSMHIRCIIVFFITLKIIIVHCFAKPLIKKLMTDISDENLVRR